jgi:hypothetical protein
MQQTGLHNEVFLRQLPHLPHTFSLVPQRFLSPNQEPREKIPIFGNSNDKAVIQGTTPALDVDDD